MKPFITSWGMGYRLNEEAFLPFGARAEDEFGQPALLQKEASVPVAVGVGVTTASSVERL